MRGGARPGAGRPKGTTNENLGKESSERKQHQYRATDEEHELVKRFIKILRNNPEKAKELIE